MFWKKANLIKELRAATETNKITIRLQDETIQKYMKLATDRAEALSALNAKFVVLTNERNVAQEELAASRALALDGNRILQEATEELRLTQEELRKCQEKLQEKDSELAALQNELFEERGKAQREAQRNSFGSLHEVNDFPGGEPERKALGSAREVYEGVGREAFLRAFPDGVVPRE